MKKKPMKKKTVLKPTVITPVSLSRCSCGYIIFTGAMSCPECARLKKGK